MIELLFYWQLVEVVKAARQDASPEDFHLQLFKMYWQHDENDTEQLERIYMDLYNSNKFLNEYNVGLYRNVRINDLNLSVGITNPRRLT